MDNWPELCALKNCDQFPRGYLTEEVGHFFLYLPLSFYAESEFGPKRDLYVELDADGLVQRAVRVENGSYGFHTGLFCCTKLSEHFGIRPPQKTGYNTHNAGFSFQVVKEWKPGLPQGNLFKDSLKSIDDLKTTGLKSFDDNFWVVEFTKEPSRARYRSLLLISKRPLLFGRHVWLYCERACDVAPVMALGDPKPELPYVEISSMRNWGYSADRACFDMTKPCEQPESPYEVVPGSLAWIEDIIEALMTKPASDGPYRPIP